jgi:peptidoglycan-associated lipoprotein
MVRKTLIILILIFCFGLMMTGCPKKTVIKEEPSIKTTEEFEAKREPTAKVEAKPIAKVEAEPIAKVEAKPTAKVEAEPTANLEAERAAKEARERELAKKREEEASKVKEKELEKSLVAKKEPGIQGEILESQMLKDIHFDFDQYEIRPGDVEILNENAALLKKYSDVAIQIEGHCDERGTVEYNLALGERRANSTKNYLVSLGISPDHISTISYGEERPLDPGHNEEAWAKNRRAHMIILFK